MLFAVEGGGFFSSSASGYSKGISLLLLGHQKDEEEKQMKISPWNHHHHYQLVDQGSKLHPAELASSGKNHLARRCASFICFRRANSSPGQKMEPTQQPQDTLDPAGKGRDGICTDEGNNVKRIPLKSNLKKHSTTFPVPCRIGDEALCEEEDGNIGRRKVQWTDVLGGDLVDIREYEPSEDDVSDDGEFDVVNEKTCMCRIM